MLMIRSREYENPDSSSVLPSPRCVVSTQSILPGTVTMKDTISSLNNLIIRYQIDGNKAPMQTSIKGTSFCALTHLGLNSAT